MHEEYHGVLHDDDTHSHPKRLRPAQLIAIGGVVVAIAAFLAWRIL